MIFRMTAKNEYLKMQVDILRHILWSLINLLFYPIVTVITNMYLAYRLARYSYRSGMLENSVLRKCNEAVLESMPQLCIQLMILLVSWPSDDSVSPTQLLSIITSLLSLSSGCASWFCFTNGNDKPGLLGTFSITFMFTLILAPRLFGFALILAYEREIGVMMIAGTMILSFGVIFPLNKRWNAHELQTWKDYVIHSIFDSISYCSFLGHIFWGNVINVTIQGICFLLLPIMVVYNITPIKDCSIPIYSRSNLLRNSSSNGTCLQFDKIRCCQNGRNRNGRIRCSRLWC